MHAVVAVLLVLPDLRVGAELLGRADGEDVYAVGELAKVIADVGLSAMRFFGMLIAIFIGIQLVYKEIERRTIYSLLAKPLRRSFRQTRPRLLL